MNAAYSLLIIFICGTCTLLERALPFIVFRGREVPETVKYLGKVLPMAIMATLIVYCLKNVSFHAASAYLPQLIASAVTAGLHLWKRNAMLSIFVGTACCMVLMRLLSL